MSDIRGVTLIETMVALSILISGLAGTFALVTSANAGSSASKAREGATNLAREISEQVRALPYEGVEPAAITAVLQGQPGLGDVGPAAGWQVTRRGFTYTVVAEVCAIDDRGDGYGDHAEGGFCPDSTGTDPANADASAQDLKRVGVAISFTERGGRTTTQRLSATIGSGGRATGLAVTSLQIVDPGPPASSAVITSAAVTQLRFRATVPAATTRLLWSTDGRPGSPDATQISPTEWEFTWTILGVSDGTYTVAAQASDAANAVGPTREIAVRLVRGAPAAPAGLVGGYNTIGVAGTPTDVAELDWTSSPELNVEGYEVTRGDGTLACSGRESACIDFGPPAQTATDAARTYSVRALYVDATGTLARSAPTTVRIDPITSSSSGTSVVDTPLTLPMSGTTANVGSACVGGTRRDLTDSTPTTVPMVYGAAGASASYCSPLAPAGFSLPAQTATARVWVRSTLNGNKRCTLTAEVWRRGSATTLLGSQSITFRPSTADGETPFPIALTPVVAGGGDRLNLEFTWSADGSCSSLDLEDPLSRGTTRGSLSFTARTTTGTSTTTTTRPDPPTTPVVTAEPDGSIKLTWSRPAAGPPVGSYRVYADGTDHTQRLAATGDGTTATESYVLPAGTRSYYVTAVSPSLTESVPLGPVNVP